MDHLKVPIHHQITPIQAPPSDPHFYLGPEAMFVIVILIWWLWGLWIYLDARAQEENTPVWIICGPAAWLAALWYLTHQKLFRREKPLLPKEQWEAPKTNRWKN